MRIRGIARFIDIAETPRRERSSRSAEKCVSVSTLRRSVGWERTFVLERPQLVEHTCNPSIEDKQAELALFDCTKHDMRVYLFVCLFLDGGIKATKHKFENRQTDEENAMFKQQRFTQQSVILLRVWTWNAHLHTHTHTDIRVQKHTHTHSDDSPWLFFLISGLTRNSTRPTRSGRCSIS